MLSLRLTGSDVGAHAPGRRSATAHGGNATSAPSSASSRADGLLDLAGMSVVVRLLHHGWHFSPFESRLPGLAAQGVISGVPQLDGVVLEDLIQQQRLTDAEDWSVPQLLYVADTPATYAEVWLERSDDGWNGGAPEASVAFKLRRRDAAAGAVPQGRDEPPPPLSRRALAAQQARSDFKFTANAEWALHIAQSLFDGPADQVAMQAVLDDISANIADAEPGGGGGSADGDTRGSSSSSRSRSSTGAAAADDVGQSRKAAAQESDGQGGGPRPAWTDVHTWCVCVRISVPGTRMTLLQLQAPRSATRALTRRLPFLAELDLPALIADACEVGQDGFVAQVPVHTETIGTGQLLEVWLRK